MSTQKTIEDLALKWAMAAFPTATSDVTLAVREACQDAIREFLHQNRPLRLLAALLDGYTLAGPTGLPDAMEGIRYLIDRADDIKVEPAKPARQKMSLRVTVQLVGEGDFPIRDGNADVLNDRWILPIDGLMEATIVRGRITKALLPPGEIK